MAFPSPTTTWHRKPSPTIDPSRPELKAKGKNIVITGGGTGIGAETAHLIIGRREAPLLSTKSFISEESPGVKVFIASADTTNKTAIDAAFADFCKDGKIDVLVSNAAVGGLVSPIKDADPDDWFSGIQTNIKGAFVVAQSFLRYAAPGAVVIDVSTCVCHLNVSGDTSSYGAGKADSLRFFHALAHEHPELTVYHLHPGMIITEGAKSSLKIGLPAAYCVWLASPEATFLKDKFMWSNWDVDELREK
ncbi:NAD(P)-binding protein [Sporormia fimetaria CBS 119925]|uniref:NAD(P)-binding protein n=1 Tax=Sporormia fimetaria CBS 119925 TaxID=1340428 RepID=A0A6A6V8H8_9PLEO|nr:NAD(P)-binding protein [Sporormia fimetaria CBS 119925]